VKTVTERHENKQCSRDVFDALSRPAAQYGELRMRTEPQNTPSYAVVFGAIPQ